MYIHTSNLLQNRQASINYLFIQLTANWLPYRRNVGTCARRQTISLPHNLCGWCGLARRITPQLHLHIHTDTISLLPTPPFPPTPVLKTWAFWGCFSVVVHAVCICTLCIFKLASFGMYELDSCMCNVYILYKCKYMCNTFTNPTIFTADTC